MIAQQNEQVFTAVQVDALLPAYVHYSFKATLDVKYE